MLPFYTLFHFEWISQALLAQDYENNLATVLKFYCRKILRLALTQSNASPLFQLFYPEFQKGH